MLYLLTLLTLLFLLQSPTIINFIFNFILNVFKNGSLLIVLLLQQLWNAL